MSVILTDTVRDIIRFGGTVTFSVNDDEMSEVVIQRDSVVITAKTQHTSQQAFHHYMHTIGAADILIGSESDSDGDYQFTFMPSDHPNLCWHGMTMGWDGRVDMVISKRGMVYMVELVIVSRPMTVTIAESLQRLIETGSIVSLNPVRQLTPKVSRDPCYYFDIEYTADGRRRPVIDAF